MIYLRGVFYSLPVQLLFLHFRKYQVLLLFWALLFAASSGSFMKSFGADALYLAPEYLGEVGSAAAAFTGASIAVFIMCWNITTFILFSRHFPFLAATQFPFLKYCINNSILPISFLLFYFFHAYRYLRFRELVPAVELFFMTVGFLIGLVLLLTIFFFYFFRADKTILRRLQPLFKGAKTYLYRVQPERIGAQRSLIRSEWFLDSFTKVRRCRDVSHYSDELMEKLFKQHHFAAVLSVLIAYLFLILIGYFMDYRAFQIPAGASFTLLCAILIGVSGALAYFFQSWTLPAFLLILLLLNILYKAKVIDPRNRAYGLNYSSKTAYPAYTQEHLAQVSDSFAVQDRLNMEAVLNRWKARQGEERPLLIVMTTSGGGTRSATFTVDLLQRLDSLTGGTILDKTFLITGASGGMIGATYFRELHRMRKVNPTINLQSRKWEEEISRDLLNPTFSSFVARDVFAPEQHFSSGKYTYLRDRGYSFEQALNHNTGGILDKRLIDYVADESAGRIPLMFYHNVITRDGKMMLTSTQPLRFMMKPKSDSISSRLPADAIDFTTFFARQDPFNIRLLTLLRMNATFPIVLPNVWMPSEPAIDVMDGGLRDNYGVETSLRFLGHMQDWIREHTRGVLILQIRDRMDGGWDKPYVTDDITSNAVKPFFLLQQNWYKMMEYFQNDMSSFYLGRTDYPVHQLSFQYIPVREEDKAALSFHLTKRERDDIRASLNSGHNMRNYGKLLELMKDSGAGKHPSAR